MTTPRMRTISWAQERKLLATGWLDRLLTSGTPAWKCPPPDTYQVPRDRTPAGTSSPLAWGTYDLPVTVAPSALSTYQGVRQGGMPVENIPANAPNLPVWIYSPDHGKPRIELVPIPRGENVLEVNSGTSRGGAWIEGAPMMGGAYDRHWLGVYPDGSGWELIQAQWSFNPIVGGDGWAWWAQEAVQFDADGDVLRGYPVTKGGVRLAAQLLTPEVLDNPAVLGCVFPNLANGDGTDKAAPVSYGDWFRLPAPPDPKKWTGDAFKLLSVLHTHGMRPFDRMGAEVRSVALVTQAGFTWPESNISTVRLRTSDFERVSP